MQTINTVARYAFHDKGNGRPPRKPIDAGHAPPGRDL
jgi:hypothetical protein